MNGKRQKIVHVFEDKLCRFCTKSCGIKYYNVFDNLLMYKQNPISFETIINVVLDLNVILINRISGSVLKSVFFRLKLEMENRISYVTVANSN